MFCFFLFIYRQCTNERGSLLHPGRLGTIDLTCAFLQTADPLLRTRTNASRRTFSSGPDVKLIGCWLAFRVPFPIAAKPRLVVTDELSRFPPIHFFCCWYRGASLGKLAIRVLWLKNIVCTPPNDPLRVWPIPLALGLTTFVAGFKSRDRR